MTGLVAQGPREDGTAEEEEKKGTENTSQIMRRRAWGGEREGEREGEIREGEASLDPQLRKSKPQSKKKERKRKSFIEFFCGF